MISAQAKQIARFTRHGWTRSTVLVNANEPDGTIAVVLKGKVDRNIAVVYPDGSFDRLEGTQTKMQYRQGWSLREDQAASLQPGDRRPQEVTTLSLKRLARDLHKALFGGQRKNTS